MTRGRRFAGACGASLASDAPAGEAALGRSAKRTVNRQASCASEDFRRADLCKFLLAQSVIDGRFGARRPFARGLVARLASFSRISSVVFGPFSDDIIR